VEGKVNRVLWVTLLSFLSFGCSVPAPHSKAQLSYVGHLFAIPANASVILSTGGEENILILRYGAAKGERYLGFSDMAADRSLDLGCRPSAFFAAVFADGVDTGCNKEGIDAFQKVFVDAKDTGVWSGEKLTVYYSISDDHSFLFAFDKSDKAFKIDTDFLTKNDLKDLVSGAL
jgi:hypothetical protein